MISRPGVFMDAPRLIICKEELKENVVGEKSPHYLSRTLSGIQYLFIVYKIWINNPYYVREDKKVKRFIFWFFIPSFFLIWLRCVSTVLVAKFIIFAISFVVLPCFIISITWISVGESLVKFTDRLCINGEMMSFKFDSMISK